MRIIVSTHILLFYAFPTHTLDLQDTNLKHPLSLKFAAAQAAATKLSNPDTSILNAEMKEYFDFFKRNQESQGQINHNELLLDAIKNNEPSIIEDLLNSKKVDPNTVYKYETKKSFIYLYFDTFTPLVFAAYYNNPIAINQLLKHGANPDRKDLLTIPVREKTVPARKYPSCYTPPLHIAALKDNIAAAQELLHHNIDSNQGDISGQSALHESKSAAMTELLISFGANIDQQDASRNTPLMAAIKKNSIDIINLLLKHNARQDLRNYRKQTALEVAKEAKNDAALYLLTKPLTKPGEKPFFANKTNQNFILSRRFYDQSTQGMRDIL